MSQVKFILLGTITEPKRDYLVNDETKTEYKSSLEEARLKYPGAVIFTTFVKSVGGKPKNEIYANGQLYSAGGSGSGAVYYGTVDVDTNGLIENFSSTHEGAEPEKGNVYIYNPDDDSAKTPGENVADCTAYYYNGDNWVAFTGNVNAENVWFPNGILRTAGWGIKNATTNNTVTTECKNNNLKLLLEYYLVTEVWPNLTYGQTTVPTFNATDGQITIPANTPTEYLLKTNANDNPSVTFTYTAPSSNYAEMSVESPFEVLSTVSGMTYGYRSTVDSETISTSTSASSTEKTASFNLDSANGTILVGKRVKDTTGNSFVMDTNNCGSSVTVDSSHKSATYDCTIPVTTLTSGTNINIISGGTYFESINATWSGKDLDKVDGQNINSITPAPIPTLYYCNNKKESNSKKYTSYTPSSIKLPTVPSGSRSTYTYTYAVYLPIIIQYLDESGRIRTLSNTNKYYGENNKTFNNIPLGEPIAGDSSLRFAFYIPKGTNIASFNISGTSWLSLLEQKRLSDSEEFFTLDNGLKYKKFMFKTTFTGAYASDSKISLTLNKL